MTRSLRFRVLALVAGFGFATALLMAAIMFSSVRGYYVDMAHEKAARFVERVIERHPDLWGTWEQRPDEFAGRLREFTLYAPNTALYLLNLEGRVLASSSETRPPMAVDQVDLAPVKAALASDLEGPTLADDPDEAGHLVLVTARPLLSEGLPAGWLYVVARSVDLGAQTPELLRSYAIRTAVTVALVTLALGVLLTITMLALLTRPLVALTRVVERVRASGFSETPRDEELPNATREDEVGRLARTFRDTFDRLHVEMERVRDTDNLRREMVASVSHDLRTPLTALIGQLETVRMKAASLSAREQEQLHARALQNAQHLRRLTEALAELSRLDNPEFRAHPEPIAVGELADDVVQRFTARAADVGLNLTLDYPDGLPLANLDAGLIERALANLLDNALRVTPAGGRVHVSVRREADRLHLEVSDTGPGVAPEDQGRIFEQFYQAAQHRELRGSSGLGLAIVRRVAELHGGRAGVQSVAGQGSRFFLDLPQMA